jgi:hypothetical protein
MKTKSWVVLVGMLAVAISVAGGCGGGGGPTGPGNNTPTPAPRASVSARAVVEGSDDSIPLGGITVVVVGASPAITTTTAADGTFSLQVPVGVVLFRLTGPGYWGTLVGLDVPAAGLAGLDFPLESEASMEATGGILGYGISTANGVVIVIFNNESGLGGESASISAASDPPFVVTPEGAYLAGNTLLAGAPPAVGFTNVPPGTTGVTVSGRPGTNTCTVQPTSVAAWPVEPKVITFLFAFCL